MDAPKILKRALLAAAAAALFTIPASAVLAGDYDRGCGCYSGYDAYDGDYYRSYDYAGYRDGYRRDGYDDGYAYRWHDGYRRDRRGWRYDCDRDADHCYVRRAHDWDE